MERQPAAGVRHDDVTHGSATRPARPLRRPVLVDLVQTAQSLFDEPEWADGDRNSRTVATTNRMRVTLTALRAGAELGSRELTDTMSIEVLRGDLTLRLHGDAVDLHAGQLTTIEEPNGWSLAAQADSVLLLTVALDSEPGSTAPRPD